MFKIKGGIKLRQLQNFGYKYVGNYNILGIKKTAPRYMIRFLIYIN